MGDSRGFTVLFRRLLRSIWTCCIGAVYAGDALGLLLLSRDSRVDREVSMATLRASLLLVVYWDARAECNVMRGGGGEREAKLFLLCP